MPARAITSGTLSFGLVSIPFKLYTAASSESISFHQLHDKCGNRIKYQVYCPVDDEVVDRSDLVKGYEYAKGQYVRFDADELKALEEEKTHNLEIIEFVPLSTVDFVYVEKSYYLGPDKGGQKAYRLLSEAMRETGRVALGRYVSRGKSHLVLIRPYEEGLIMHQLFYANEVRDFGEIDLGEDVSFKSAETEMARQLIEQLSVKRFEPEKFEDEFRARVLEAVEEKIAGHEITTTPEAPKAKVIDLFEALKASVEESEAKKRKLKPPKKAAGKKAAAGKGTTKKTRKKKAASGKNE
ncbi:MAG TPA: Ku protein [Polyangiales bacterium]|nr:Ku protein [Polyangiales bacterium]